MTPPPNYDTALQILARSHESVLGKPPLLRRQSSTSSSFRRSFSFDLLNNNQTRQNNLLPFDETETNNTDKHEVGDNIRQNSDLTITVSWYRISMPFFLYEFYIYSIHMRLNLRTYILQDNVICILFAYAIKTIYVITVIHFSYDNDIFSSTIN